MGQRPNEPTTSDSIDEFFEPVLGEAMDDALEAEEPKVSGRSRLAKLRRRAEQRLEDRRIQDELDCMELDWEDA